MIELQGYDNVQFSVGEVKGTENVLIMAFCSNKTEPLLDHVITVALVKSKHAKNLINVLVEGLNG